VRQACIFKVGMTAGRMCLRCRCANMTLRAGPLQVTQDPRCTLLGWCTKHAVTAEKGTH
jgi:hypothetical protein